MDNARRRHSSFATMSFSFFYDVSFRSSAFFDILSEDEIVEYIRGRRRVLSRLLGLLYIGDTETRMLNGARFIESPNEQYIYISLTARRRKY